MLGIGFSELLMVLLIGVLVFGVNKLPEIGKSIGEGLREFNGPVDKGSDKNSESF